jgi:zinc D-Ala-D-Ala carboxypeptidase
MFNYFKKEEFACKCGCGENTMQASTMQKLNIARELASIPFVVTSGRRCSTHNQWVGGKSESAHTKGHAADIRCRNSRERFLIVDAALAAGFSRIGIAKTFIHLDDDPSLPEGVMWDY